MTTTRKIASNRRNSRLSRGPASAAGKKIASRNALRHGLTALRHHYHPPSQEIDRISKALRGDNNDPALVEAAVKVAETEVALRAVRQQKLAAVSRLHDPKAIALVKGDNSLAIAQARFMQSWLISRDLEVLVPKLQEKYKDKMKPSLPRESREGEVPPRFELYDGMVPMRLKALLGPRDSSGEQPPNANTPKIELEERDEHEALTEALPDLLKLDRYEQRALCRQQHALGEFMNIKLMQKLAAARRARL
jgi:hypothetical protein